MHSDCMRAPASEGWQKGRAVFNDCGPKDSWLNQNLEDGGVMIVKLRGKDLHCRGAAASKVAYVILRLRDGRREELRPGYDYQPSLKDAMKLAEVRAAIAKAGGEAVKS